jgi:hypothetical protein
MKIGPFVEGASGYTANGWPVVPVETGGKRVAVDGWTGHDGKYPSRANVRSWVRDFPAHNIAIRLPASVIGIDVDAYDDKAGLESIQRLESELGALPATYVSSSRDDGISGIRLYRVPVSDVPASWKGKAAEGIDVICWHYRYIVCAPSVHPEGGIYAWYQENDDNSNLTPSDMPNVSGLPDLPEAWIEFLSREAAGMKTGKLLRADITSWLKRVGAGKPCDMMTETCDHWRAELDGARGDGGAHDAMLNGVKAVIGDAVAGHSGMYGELTRLRNAFIAAVSSRRDRDAIDSEWRRAIYGAVRMYYDSAVEEDDPCADETLMSMNNVTTLSGRVLSPESFRKNKVAAEDSKLRKAVDGARWNMKVQTLARREELLEHAASAPEMMPMDLWMERDIESPRPLVKSLMSMDGHTLLVAQPKAGKTRLAHNLIRSVADDEPFLDVLDVMRLPDRRKIVLLDFEMQEGNLRDWLAEQKVKNPSRVAVSSLVNSASSFNIMDPFTMMEWARKIEAMHAGYVIFDCCAPAWAAIGLDENSNSEQGAWLDMYVQMIQRSGASGSLVIHHTGRQGDHARGASRIEGWASDLFRLTLQGNGEDDDGKFVRADRFLSARGRMIREEFEVMLSFDGARLSVGGGNKMEVASDRARPEVIAYVKANQPCTSIAAIEDAVTGRSEVIRRVIRELLADETLCDHGLKAAGKANRYCLFLDCEDEAFHTAKLKVR